MEKGIEGQNKSEVRGEDKQGLNNAAHAYAFENGINGVDYKFVKRDFLAGAKWAESQSVELREENARLREALEGLYNYTKGHKDLVGFIKFEYLKNKASEALNQIKKEESTPPEQPGEDQEALFGQLTNEFINILYDENGTWSGADNLIAFLKSRFTLSRNP